MLRKPCLSSIVLDPTQVPDTEAQKWTDRRHWTVDNDLNDLTWSEATEVAEDHNEWHDVQV